MRLLSRIRKVIFCSVLHMHPLPFQFLVLTSYIFSTIHIFPTLNVILLLPAFTYFPSSYFLASLEASYFNYFFSEGM